MPPALYPPVGEYPCSFFLADAVDVHMSNRQPSELTTINMKIIGIAGSSGSGKTSLAMKIVGSLNLPWVVILSMVPVHPDGICIERAESIVF